MKLKMIVIIIIIIVTFNSMHGSELWGPLGLAGLTNCNYDYDNMIMIIMI